MRNARLSRAIVAVIGMAGAVALAGCGKPAPQATAAPASLTEATPAATASLPPGSYYGQAGGGAGGTSPARVAPAPADPPPAAAAPQFAQVVAVQPVTQSVTTSHPHQVCNEEQVAVPETYRDQHQIGGAVAGGLLGALAGHMIGGGHGRTLATIAGAAGGAFAGHEIQKRHQEDNPTQLENRNVCHTVNDASTSTTTVGYNVTYTLDGRAGHIRMSHAPVVGTGLPVRDGAVVAPGTLASSH